MKRQILLWYFLILIGSIPGSAQLPSGGYPPSFELEEQLPFNTFSVSAPDMEEVRRTDADHSGTNRFGVPRPLNADLSAGSWTTLDNGDRIWRLKIEAPGAKGLIVLFDQFWLPPGAKLFVYDPVYNQILGAYTDQNNRPTNDFLAGIIHDESLIIELYEPALFKGLTQLHCSKLMYCYEPQRIQSDYPFQVKEGQGFGDALPCHINVNCPEATNWQEHKKGISRILRVFEEGVGWCSGALINTTENNGFPYLLSAYHCQADFTPIYSLWRFDFQYEFPTCNSSPNEPGYYSLLGCQVIAGREESDFLLFQLDYGIPYVFDPYFTGWDRSPNAIPSEGFFIHHPNGDVKKYSHDADPLVIQPTPIQWNNGVQTPANHHFKVIFDEGTMEGGSSGSPLFNPEGRIVAQLHGGMADCNSNITYHGRLTKSWDEGATPETRLQDWLAPGSANPLTEDPFIPSDTLFNLGGLIVTPTGEGLAGVQVILEGAIQDTVTTDSEGLFSFPFVLRGQQQSVRFEKDTGIDNGVTTFDGVIMQKHILQIEPLNDTRQLIAADVDNNGTITTFDIVQLQKVILGLSTEFPNNTSWRFLPENINIDDLPVHWQNIQLTGIKVGDVNFSAAPE